MNPTLRLTKLYNYPAHAVRVFSRVVVQQAAQGRSLRALTKGHFLGTGVSLKFEFDDGAPQQHQLNYFYGRQRHSIGDDTNGGKITSVLPMKLAWFTIGYFYVLTQTKNAT